MRRILSICLCFALLMGLASPVYAGDFPDTGVIGDTAAKLLETVPSPMVGSVGGEWAVIGLARSDSPAPAGYFEGYYAKLSAYVTAHDGVLSDRKYTEYARVILALTALGANPADVAGVNLLTPLGDYEKTIWQGINGPIWALIALDSGEYDVPVSAADTQATRQMYVDAILAAQCPDGGFSLADGKTGDPDVTGMALQALAKYQTQDKVAAAVGKALACLSGLQRNDGCFETDGVPTLESTVQVAVALCELGIPLDDARFVKEKGGLTDGLMLFYNGEGSFSHGLTEGGDDLMATEQAFYALVAADRIRTGRQSLYRMSDAADLLGADTENMPSRNPDIVLQQVLYPGVTFSDIMGSEGCSSVEALAERGILSGRGDGTFDPGSTMTRAEFCACTVRALGLTPSLDGRFSDVAADSWYAGYVGTAARYGIVNGVTETSFSPAAFITRQEAAVMLARAAKLTGLVTEVDDAAATRLLAAFDDNRQVALWAKESLAFCYGAGIFDDGEMEIRPKAAIMRMEVAQALFRLLSCAELL
ncbi:hypothetical protein SDC9_66591 [bioreactor metagenome]|uniref:SLH domain-containing protein n=1 Tax=bioreactor metagenome TaxID=1076179 RepID=A0A644XVC2_9ZZZZ